MRVLTPFLLAAGALAQAIPSPAEPIGSLYRVPAPVPPALRAVLELRFDCLCGGHAPGNDLQLVVFDDQVAELRALAPTAVFEKRGEPFRDVERRRQGAAAAPDPGYFTVAEIVQELNAQAAAYPQLAMVVDLTTWLGVPATHDGNHIFALKVSDAVALDESEPAVVVAAQHHARELNSPYMVIGGFRRILQGYATDPALRALVDGHELWFVPCVNPDGVDHVWNVYDLWRKNRRDNGGGRYGVDNNRNYPFMWSSSCGGSTATNSETYRGPSAGSEPETQTMMALQRRLRPSKYIDFHSSGREVLITYNSCARTDSQVRALVDHYVADLAAPMSYGSRFPSASGESPEWHWADGGTLSFLIEVGTAFQPPFQDTVNEEQRVWPGLRQALTAWQPALRGRVRSLDGTPLAATISYAPNRFLEGERIAGRDDGVYQAWLPLGTHQVTFQAAGHRDYVRTVTVSGYDQPLDLDVCLVPAWADATLTVQGTHRIGTVSSLTYHSPGDAGDRYMVALALGTTPGIPVGCDRTLPLNGDALFFTSLLPGSPLVNHLGILPGSEQVTAQFLIPPLAVLVGLTVHTAGVTLADPYPLTVKKFSPSQPITLQ